MESTHGNKEEATKLYEIAEAKGVLNSRHQRPYGMLDPDVASQPFWEPSMFPWVKLLEENFDVRLLYLEK